MDQFARLDNYTIAYIAQLFARDDEISNLIRLAGTSRRIRAICLPLIAKYIDTSEMRRTDTCWLDERGLPHRCNLLIDGNKIIQTDLPAVCGRSYGWMRHGERHRKAGPAVIESGGRTREWYHNGQLHREGAPAIIIGDDLRLWYSHGAYYRRNEITVIWLNKFLKWWRDVAYYRVALWVVWP